MSYKMTLVPHVATAIKSIMTLSISWKFKYDYLFFQLGLRSGSLLRFAIGDGGLSIVDGKIEKADLHYLGKVNRARAFADSYSKVCAKYMCNYLFSVNSVFC